MTSISKNMYNDKLYEVVKKYNNKYHRTIKIKSDNEKSNMYIDFNKKNKKKNPKFKIGDNFEISKYKDIFAKGLHSKLV